MENYLKISKKSKKRGKREKREKKGGKGPLFTFVIFLFLKNHVNKKAHGTNHMTSLKGSDSFPPFGTVTWCGGDKKQIFVHGLESEDRRIEVIWILLVLLWSLNILRMPASLVNPVRGFLKALIHAHVFLSALGF